MYLNKVFNCKSCPGKRFTASERIGILPRNGQTHTKKNGIVIATIPCFVCIETSIDNDKINIHPIYAPTTVIRYSWKK